MTLKEEKELLKSVEQDEWKPVQNFFAIKKELERCANSTKSFVLNSAKDSNKFQAIKLKTKDYKFDREEANARL